MALSWGEVNDSIMGCSGYEQGSGRVACFSFEAFRSLIGEIGLTTSINDRPLFSHECGSSRDNGAGFSRIVGGGHR